MPAFELEPLGTWTPGRYAAAFASSELLPVVARVREPAHVVRDGPRGAIGVGLEGRTGNGAAGGAGATNGAAALPWLATLPPLFPEWLGDRSFLDVHRVRFPYIAGEMANGIATTAMVVAMAQAGMLGFFGAAGLSPARVEKALDEIGAALGASGASWGSNLIHSPNEPDLEEAVVDLYLRRRVQRVSASAYMELTPAVVRYAASGLALDPAGNVRRRNHVFAKLSRPEVARRFMSPPPEAILQALVAAGKLSVEEARLAARLPLAEDVTVEADSGGHTDNQALTALFPTIVLLRDRLTALHGYRRPIRVGAAGGLGTPTAVAAAFALGAAYVLTGSINQSAVEAGLSATGKRMLAQAELTDVVMAPSADMFELGVKVQVLQRGTLFGVRAARLYELYRTYDSLEALPADLRLRLEKEILRAPVEEVWEATRQFFAERDPRENERAARDPKHRMALVFRWYLGKSSGWAVGGDRERQMDYQVWCGPAMGAFNAWVAGSFLEPLDNRGVVQIARNLLEGAAVTTRAHQLRSYGVPVPDAAFQFAPRPLA